MAVEKEYPGHPDLTGGGETSLHSHAGGGGGADVKGGIVTGVSESSQKQVNFGTAFGSTPTVTATVKDTGGNKSSTPCVEDITTGGFKISTKGDDIDILWVATDAGNL